MAGPRNSKSETRFRDARIFGPARGCVPQGERKVGVAEPPARQETRSVGGLGETLARAAGMGACITQRGWPERIFWDRGILRAVSEVGASGCRDDSVARQDRDVAERKGVEEGDLRDPLPTSRFLPSPRCFPGPRSAAS